MYVWVFESDTAVLASNSYLGAAAPKITVLVPGDGAARSFIDVRIFGSGDFAACSIFDVMMPVFGPGDGAARSFIVVSMSGSGDGAACSFIDVAMKDEFAAGGTKKGIALAAVEEKKNEHKSGVASHGAAVQDDESVAGRRRFGPNQSGVASRGAAVQEDEYVAGRRRFDSFREALLNGAKPQGAVAGSKVKCGAPRSCDCAPCARDSARASAGVRDIASEVRRHGAQLGASSTPLPPPTSTLPTLTSVGPTPSTSMRGERGMSSTSTTRALFDQTARHPQSASFASVGNQGGKLARDQQDQALFVATPSTNCANPNTSTSTSGWQSVGRAHQAFGRDFGIIQSTRGRGMSLRGSSRGLSSMELLRGTSPDREKSPGHPAKAIGARGTASSVPVLPKHKATTGVRDAASSERVLPKHNVAMGKASVKLLQKERVLPKRRALSPGAAGEHTDVAKPPAPLTEQERLARVARLRVMCDDQQDDSR